MMDIGLSVMEMIGLAVLVCGAGIAIINMLQLVTAFWTLSRRSPPLTSQENWQRFSDFAPTISLIVPAYNEAETIVSSVGALLAIEYPDFEVIVVNDGSKDDTIARLVDAFDLEAAPIPEQGSLRHKILTNAFSSPTFMRLLVLDKVNGGKADALNAGINLARGKFVCVIDADSILDRDALLRASRSFIEHPGEVVAIGGSIRLTNGCNISASDILEIAPPLKYLPLMQTLEYLRTFHLSRTAMSAAGALTLISGSFGLFSKDLLLAIGGYTHDTVGEDYELGMRLHRHLRDTGQHKAKIIYLPDAVCWTQAPESFAVLGRQRSRWQRGAMETLWRHRDMIANPRYGRIAALSMFEAVLTDILTPITEFMGFILIPIFILIGALSPDYFIAFVSISVGLGIAQSTGAILVEEMRFRRFPKTEHILVLLLAAIIENFGYRQLCSWWRIKGFIEFLQGKKQWGTMTRQKLST